MILSVKHFASEAAERVSMYCARNMIIALMILKHLPIFQKLPSGSQYTASTSAAKHQESNCPVSIIALPPDSVAVLEMIRTNRRQNSK